VSSVAPVVDPVPLPPRRKQQPPAQQRRGLGGLGGWSGSGPASGEGGMGLEPLGIGLCGDGAGGRRRIGATVCTGSTAAGKVAAAAQRWEVAADPSDRLLSACSQGLQVLEPGSGHGGGRAEGATPSAQRAFPRSALLGCVESLAALVLEPLPPASGCLPGRPGRLGRRGAGRLRLARLTRPQQQMLQQAISLAVHGLQAYYQQHQELGSGKCPSSSIALDASELDYAKAGAVEEVVVGTSQGEGWAPRFLRCLRSAAAAQQAAAGGGSAGDPTSEQAHTRVMGALGELVHQALVRQRQQQRGSTSRAEPGRNACDCAFDPDKLVGAGAPAVHRQQPLRAYLWRCGAARRQKMQAGRQGGGMTGPSKVHSRGSAGAGAVPVPGSMGAFEQMGTHGQSVGETAESMWPRNLTSHLCAPAGTSAGQGPGQLRGAISETAHTSGGAAHRVFGTQLNAQQQQQRRRCHGHVGGRKRGRRRLAGIALHSHVATAAAMAAVSRLPVAAKPAMPEPSQHARSLGQLSGQQERGSSDARESSNGLRDVTAAPPEVNTVGRARRRVRWVRVLRGWTIACWQPRLVAALL
jgi:hypothetical protein